MPSIEFSIGITAAMSSLFSSFNARIMLEIDFKFVLTQLRLKESINVFFAKSL